MLLDLKRRGMKDGPKLAIGDGALGFWAALREVFPGCREQRCWVHYADLGIMPISLLKSAFWAVSAVVGSA